MLDDERSRDNYSGDDHDGDNQENLHEDDGYNGVSADHNDDDQAKDDNQLPEPLPGSMYGNEEEQEYYDEDELEVDEGASPVASHPGRNVLMLGGFILSLAFVLYFILFSGPEEAPVEELPPLSENTPVREATQPTPAPDIGVGVVDTPMAPELSTVEGLEPPPFPTSSQETQDEDSVFNSELPDFFGSSEPEISPADLPPVVENELPDFPALPEPDNDLPGSEDLPPLPSSGLPSPEQRAELNARRNAGIMVLGGGGTAEGDDGSGGGGIGGFFGGGSTAGRIPNTPEPTAAVQTLATRIGDMNSIIAQGKVIDAVLESAINTDLPGVLRAIVSRDVYAESGRNILIPKGSRLIGNYESDIDSGQSRVYVIWTRVIRPDGIDVSIDSPGIDQLGRAGVEGIVDHRYMEIFGSAVLLSALTVAGAYALETATSSTAVTNSSTTGSDGSSTTSNTGTPTSFAITGAAQDLSDVAQDIVEESVNTKPRITVPQGTKVKVFVNSDLIFPKSVSQSIRFIQ